MKKAIRYKPQPLKLEEKDRLTGTGKELDYLRALRKPLLQAFDIYKSNVYYGVVTETEEEHAEVLAWYAALLDIGNTNALSRAVTITAESAIKNVPAGVRRYLK